MKFYATHIVIGLVGLSLVLIFAGCSEDETGPTPPEVDYLPQTFSLAVSDGAADNTKQDNHGYSHNGNATITLDWNGEIGGSNSLPVTYIYNEYPLIDGGATADSLPGADDGDADVWANAEWTVIPLTQQYGDGGVTSVRMKAVYTYVNPARIWFLLNWDDPVDYPNAEVPYNSGLYGNCFYNVGPTYDDEDNQITHGFEFDPEDDQKNGIAWDHNEDWVSFMWDTWDKVGSDTDFEFVPQTNNFQSNGCNVTCHEEDTSNPHYTNAAGEYVDMWFWSSSRTNFTSNGLDWLSGTNDPADIFDCFLGNDADERMRWGPVDQICYYEDDDDAGISTGDLIKWLVTDQGIAGSLTNMVENTDYGPRVREHPVFMGENDPGENVMYLWNSDSLFEFQEEFLVGQWDAGDKITNYLNAPALGSVADVGARGSYDVATGQWTLELGRNIGSYDKIAKTEDCLIGIFAAHPGQ